MLKHWDDKEGATGMIGEGCWNDTIVDWQNGISNLSYYHSSY
ncbi:MAG: hypothetical protein ACR5KX_05775 [Wolbachia sp.]